MPSTQKNDPACAVGYHQMQKNGLLCFSCGLGGTWPGNVPRRSLVVADPQCQQ